MADLTGMTGTHDVRFRCPGWPTLDFALPVNPERITWQGQMVMQTHDTRAGRHHQFIKYLRTGGVIGINTGWAKGRNLMNGWFGGGPCVGPTDYAMRLGGIIERWAKKAVTDNIGPIRMSDPKVLNHPIVMDIVFVGFPEFGQIAATTSKQLQIRFEVVEDHADKWEVSKVGTDPLPALSRARDVAYTAKAGDTVDSLAKRFYGSKELGVMISQIGANDPYIDNDGRIRPGATILIPYHPMPPEYKNLAAARSNETKADMEKRRKEVADLSGAVVDVGNAFRQAGTFLNKLASE